MNKYAPHVYVIPEDDRNRQIADGFIGHHQVQDRRIKVMPPAGGWPVVLKTFKDEYIRTLQDNHQAHVIMLIDFDGHVEERRSQFQQTIPEVLRPRVFVVGPKNNPETLKKSMNMGYEEIGRSLASDCAANAWEHWDHEQLKHNSPERERLVEVVKPFLF